MLPRQAPLAAENSLAAIMLKGKDTDILIEDSGLLDTDRDANKRFYQTAKEILHPSILTQIKNYFTEIFYGRAS